MKNELMLSDILTEVRKSAASLIADKPTLDEWEDVYIGSDLWYALNRNYPISVDMVNPFTGANALKVPIVIACAIVTVYALERAMESYKKKLNSKALIKLLEGLKPRIYKAMEQQGRTDIWDSMMD